MMDGAILIHPSIARNLVTKAYSDYETKTNIDWIKTILDSKNVYWIEDNVRTEITVTGISQVKKKKERVKLALNFRRLI